MPVNQNVLHCLHTRYPKRRWEFPSCKFMYLTTSPQTLMAGFPLFRFTICFFFGRKQEIESKSQQGTHFHLTQEAAGHWREYSSPKKQETHPSGKFPDNSAPPWRTTVTGHWRPATSLEKAKDRAMKKSHKAVSLVRVGGCRGKEKDKWRAMLWRGWEAGP